MDMCNGPNIKSNFHSLFSSSRSSVGFFFFKKKDESSLKMNRVDHIPQTLASHSRLPGDVQPQGLEWGSSPTRHGADMLRPDPRDTFFNSKSTVIISVILPYVIIAVL